MKNSMINFTYILLIVFLTVGCVTHVPKVVVQEIDPKISTMLSTALPEYPATRFVVVSDLHVYDTSLGISGKAFEEHLAEERKLIVESTEINIAAIERISHEAPDFILVCGDMTKDGEKVNHRLAASYLKELEQSGASVYVIPGNHDILNPHAFRYFGDETEPIDSVTPELFREIYNEFGFKEAIETDPDSLSYVAEPVPGLWVLALDSCLYRENETDPVIDGRFYQPTIDWLQNMLIKSVRRNKAVIVTMHHHVIEHYSSELKYYDNNIVNDYEEISRMLAEYRVRLVFTGHEHAQDITVRRWQTETNELFLYDISTGSLVTYPSPYRVVEISSDQQCNISSTYIDSIESHRTGFFEFNRNTIRMRIEGIAKAKIEGYHVSEKSADLIAPQAAEAFVAHYLGDENPPAEIINKEGINWWGRVILNAQKDLIIGVWNDLEPPDNQLVINLRDGSWQ
jgi:3',5'-cyclic AMP phosphodiesterase CpdA